MVCVESGNIADNAITPALGQRSSLVVEINSLPLGSTALPSQPIPCGPMKNP